MTFFARLLRVIKSNKKSVIGSLLVSILAAGGATFFDVGENEIKHVLFQEEEIAQPLKVEVQRIQENMIKRSDFNQYIQRKDQEYHTQTDINRSVMESIGQLQGEIKEDDEVLGRIAGRKEDP